MHRRLIHLIFIQYSGKIFCWRSTKRLSNLLWCRIDYFELHIARFRCEHIHSNVCVGYQIVALPTLALPYIFMFIVTLYLVKISSLLVFIIMNKKFNLFVECGYEKTKDIRLRWTNSGAEFISANANISPHRIHYLLGILEKCSSHVDNLQISNNLRFVGCSYRLRCVYWNRTSSIHTSSNANHPHQIKSTRITTSMYRISAYLTLFTTTIISFV